MSLCYLLMVFSSYGQSCNCPAIDECAPCSDGFNSLTLKYLGDAEVLIIVSDGIGVIYSKVILKNNTFTVINSRQSGAPFSGGFIDIKGVLSGSVKINTMCNGGLEIGDIYSDFQVVAAKSNDVPLCCPIDLVEGNPPEISNCPSDIIASAASGSCSSVVEWTEPVALDDCQLKSLTSNYKPGNIFDIGTTKVVYTATDIYNNRSECVFNIHVKDTLMPLIENCPGTQAVDISDDLCEIPVFWTAPTVMDNCEVILESNYTSGSQFPVGQTIVTYTATDASGNVSTCSFAIQVISSNISKVLMCPNDIKVTTDKPDDVVVTWETPVVTTECGEVALVSTYNPGDYFPVGTTSVHYEVPGVEDGFVCTFNVIVIYEPIKFEALPAVTPNGDGVNDVWIINNIEKYEDNEVVIIDRWGSEIFRAVGYNNTSVSWDGLNKSGDLAPVGTYFYLIKVKSGGDQVEKQGFIELLHQ